MAEKTYTTNPLKGKETLKRLKGALRNAPIIGTVADVVDIGKEVLTGDYAGAAVATGTALAGITPIGRIASKGAKVIGKKLKKLSKVDESKDSLKAINLTEKDLENWKKDPNNITSTEFKKKLEGREEELQNIAKSYKDNPTDETLDLYRRKVTELNPIKKIETMPDKPSFLDVRGALGIKVDSLACKKTGVIGLNRNIEDGQRIASRLDINGYTNHNKWVATLTIPKNLIRDWVSKNPTLSPTSYATAVRLKNVDLKQTESLQKKSLDIAAGRAKGPHAVMEGDYSADDPDDIYKYAREIFESKDKDWIQVGYNPTRAGFFYDRGTGLPIESADEILQVGPLVLAKNAIGGSIRDYMYNKGGLTTDEQTQQAFNQGGTTMEQQMSLFEEGGMKDDGLNRDPVSGNEIPPGSLAKEVRDDIPAQLSEGEYVVPADVVQYYGVKFFEDLRMQAKRGLAQMAATGRIGGEPVSVTMIAIGEEEKKKKKKYLGGPVGFTNGGVSSDVTQVEAGRTFNPNDFRTVGGSLRPNRSNPANQQGVTKTVTYYNQTTGEAHQVTFVNNTITPPEDVQYTKPPQYSLIPPSPTNIQAQRSRSDDNENRRGDSSPPGWGADPDKYDFTGWDQDRFEQEIDSLVNPTGIAGAVFGRVPLIRTGGLANAITAMKLAESKGIDTAGMQEQIDEAIKGMPSWEVSIAKGLTQDSIIVPFLENLGNTNPSVNNINTGGGDKPTPPITASTSKITPDPKPFSEADYEKSTPMGQQASYEEAAGITSKPKTTEKETKTEKATKESGRNVTGGQRKKKQADLSKAYGGGDDGNLAAGKFGGNKGGLLNKPIRNPKKPRGKGLGSK